MNELVLRAEQKIRRMFGERWRVSGILQALLPGQGWIDKPLCWNINALHHLREFGTTYINIAITDGTEIRQPDISMVEIGFGPLPKTPTPVIGNPLRRKVTHIKRDESLINAWGNILYGA